MADYNSQYTGQQVDDATAAAHNHTNKPWLDKLNQDPTSFATQAQLSDAITTAMNAALAMVPQDGLKVPISVPTESGIDRTSPSDGDNYYVQDMDINSPGNQGQVWFSEAGWNWKVDSHIPVDGVSVVLNGGAESVSPDWLAQQFEASVYLADQPRFPLLPTYYEEANFATGYNFTASHDGWLTVSCEDRGLYQGFVYGEIWIKPVIDGTVRSVCLCQRYAPGGYGALLRLTVPVRQGSVLELDTNCTSAWYEFIY